MFLSFSSGLVANIPFPFREVATHEARNSVVGIVELRSHDLDTLPEHEVSTIVSRYALAATVADRAAGRSVQRFKLMRQIGISPSDRI